ncbi:hypothetical protein K8352_13020 [Flavobacteriaceae bacterium F89]|uniref:Glycosyl hydrolase family 76 n=1 Tax=Cerina litoralis TaxID=2874477 RepID=A0AAE3EY13_9FLAO|nr:glycoside hydrolase family 76 protein [Cerina litoralis]MCG2461676.1 hypothetical protein [Cerina litoralis]
MKYVFIFGFLGTVLLNACSDEAIPLREPTDQGGDAFKYTWQTTADSIQASTYSTYLGSEGTFVADNAGSTTFNYWPNAHVLHILVDGYLRTKEDSYVPKMKKLIQGIKSKNGGTYSNVFNDDMLWLGNSSVRAFEATEDPEYKEVAEYLWTDVLTSYSDVFGGGITWKKDTPKQKNAVSNGPAIVLAMRLYKLDGNTEYLDRAKLLYEWEKNNLVDPVTGLVWDNISVDNGVVTTNKDWIFTYNVGTWIGAGIRLFNATGDRVYLDDAVKSAKSMMTSPKLTTEGLLKDEGQGDGGLFKGILVRYFIELIQVDEISEEDRNSFIKFLKFNATTFYDQGLKRPEMLAGHNWKKSQSGTVDLTTQLSGVMLIEAAAKLDKENLFD